MKVPLKVAVIAVLVKLLTLLEDIAWDVLTTKTGRKYYHELYKAWCDKLPPE